MAEAATSLGSLMSNTRALCGKAAARYGAPTEPFGSLTTIQSPSSASGNLESATRETKRRIPSSHACLCASAITKFLLRSLFGRAPEWKSPKSLPTRGSFHNLPPAMSPIMEASHVLPLRPVPKTTNSTVQTEGPESGAAAGYPTYDALTRARIRRVSDRHYGRQGQKDHENRQQEERRHAPLSSPRKDLRRAAVQAAFEAIGQVDQGQADRQVDERRSDQGRPVEGLRLQDPRRAQELGKPYDRNEGGVLHQCYELVGQGRYRPPEGLGHDDVAHRLGVGEAGGASGLHLPLVDALDAGAEDLRDVGRAVKAECHQPGEEQALEPDADRGGREVDEGYLHQKRRPPEHVYVDLGGPAQYPPAADFEQGEHEAQDYPENLRQEGERDRYEHALQDRVEIVEDYLEVQVVGLESLEVEAARVELDRHQ